MPLHFTETCEVKSRNNNNISCHVVEGKLTVFYPNTFNSTKQSEEENEFLNTIKAVMNGDKLKNCHPAIVSIKFRNQSESRLENNGYDKIHFLTSVTPDNTVLIVVIFSLIILLSTFLITKFRYHAKHIIPDETKCIDKGRCADNDGDKTVLSSSRSIFRCILLGRKGLKQQSPDKSKSTMDTSDSNFERRTNYTNIIGNEVSHKSKSQVSY